MALVNNWLFTKTLVDWPTMEKSFRNRFKVIDKRKFIDKKGVLPEGTNVQLMVLFDDFDYGVDKDGNPRSNNVYQSFNATILKPVDVSKGDVVELHGFLPDYSFAINFDMVLRFEDCVVVKQAKGENA